MLAGQNNSMSTAGTGQLGRDGLGPRGFGGPSVSKLKSRKLC